MLEKKRSDDQRWSPFGGWTFFMYHRRCSSGGEPVFPVVLHPRSGDDGHCHDFQMSISPTTTTRLRRASIKAGLDNRKCSRTEQRFVARVQRSWRSSKVMTRLVRTWTTTSQRKSSHSIMLGTAVNNKTVRQGRHANEMCCLFLCRRLVLLRIYIILVVVVVGIRWPRR